jgi:hypothetical protein
MLESVDEETTTVDSVGGVDTGSALDTGSGFAGSALDTGLAGAVLDTVEFVADVSGPVDTTGSVVLGAASVVVVGTTTTGGVVSVVGALVSVDTAGSVDAAGSVDTAGSEDTTESVEAAVPFNGMSVDDAAVVTVVSGSTVMVLDTMMVVTAGSSVLDVGIGRKPGMKSLNARVFVGGGGS